MVKLGSKGSSSLVRRCELRSSAKYISEAKEDVESIETNLKNEVVSDDRENRTLSKQHFMIN